MFSQAFNDIYFSTEDGLAESRHTYLAGNDLPQAWVDKDSFHIIELGFGSGLNFLATLKLWQETTLPSQCLRYTAIEKFPLAWEEIASGLAHWRGEIGPQLDALAAAYTTVGQAVAVTNSVMLNLRCQDVAAALPQITGMVDAIYLDGFAPAKNPDMWCADIFAQLAKLSRAGTSFACFTVACAVRQNAEAAGFTWRKQPGFGRKRHMLAGCYAGHVALRDDQLGESGN